MTKVILDADVYTTRDIDPDDSWDAGDRDGYVTDIRISKNGIGWDEKETSLEPPFYVVYAEYTTGSTFGSDFAAEIVAVVKDEEEAAEIISVGEATKNYSFEVRGKQYSANWIGYFERLRNLSYRRLA